MRRPDKKTQLTIEELEKNNEQLEQEKKKLEAQMERYKQQFTLLQQKRFGTSSEKTNKDQFEFPLFNETEVSSAILLVDPTLETINYTRKKIRRADKLKDLPVETIHYDLSDSEKVCLECDHSMHEMSTQIRKELKIIRRK